MVKMAKTKFKALVIVESPAKAKTINKYLGNQYEVVASMGHVRDLPKSKIGVDVEKDFEPHYIILQKAKKRVSQLKKDARGKSDIYLATDPDREGEAISWHLAHIFEGEKARLHRVVFNEITKDAIQKAFEHPRDIDQKLVNSQQARRILDRLVGYSLSPLLWKKVGKGLSAGRVQSVALRLIVDRENEIRRFKPQEYWSVTAKLRKRDGSRAFILAELDKVKGKKAEIKTQSEAERIRKATENSPFTIVQIEKKERKRRPTAPYTTSKLQQESYQRLRFTSARTMSIAQRLYEGVELGPEGSAGLITYMRTDSVNISKGAQAEALKFISERFGKEYVPEKPNFYKSKKSAQEAHEAIRPTSAFRTPESVQPFLSEEEFRLYSLIWKKFVASQMKEAVEEGTTALIESAKDYVFKATGTRTLFPGYLAVYEEPKEDAEDEEEKTELKDEKSRELPELFEKEVLDLEKLVPEQHFTKPPARFNDASIVKALEELGIGRPSTYAPTIQVLVLRNYVERSGALVPTFLGETVTKLLVQCFPSLLDFHFTASMEEDLDRIEEGDKEWGKVVKEFYQPFIHLVNEAKDKMKDMKQELEFTGETCEKCSKPMVIRFGRFGRFIACSGFPECKNTRPLTTDIPCPKEGCEGKLVKRKSKQGRPFYGCSSYPKCDFIANKLPEPEDKDKTAPSPDLAAPKPPEAGGPSEDKNI